MQDSTDVVTSAPDLDSIPAGADLEETFDGHGDESEIDGLRRSNAFLDRRVEDLQEQLRRERARADAAERDARLHAEGHRGALDGLAEAKTRIAAMELDVAHWKAGALGFESQVETLEAQLSAERERAAACVRGGLRSLPVEALFAEINRRVVADLAKVAAGLRRCRPVATASVIVRGDDAGNNATQDAAQGLR
ncbi:hypothetical protein [Sorangium sp. So ce388]|uniref:hypothetical protein n=1 Tax=Sorangium sp. So ce388 TaxID=3133309 RepID=UPI003F5AEC84